MVGEVIEQLTLGRADRDVAQRGLEDPGGAVDGHVVTPHLHISRGPVGVHEAALHVLGGSLGGERSNHQVEIVDMDRADQQSGVRVELLRGSAGDVDDRRAQVFDPPWVQRPRGDSGDLVEGKLVDVVRVCAVLGSQRLHLHRERARRREERPTRVGILIARSRFRARVRSVRLVVPGDVSDNVDAGDG